MVIDNVPSDTRRCRALKSSAGEEGGSYDVSDDMLQNTALYCLRRLNYHFVFRSSDCCLNGTLMSIFRRPEYVAECFLKLVETGQNGDVMIVS